VKHLQVAFNMTPSPNLDGSVILSVAHENESEPAQSFKVSNYSPVEAVRYGFFSHHVFCLILVGSFSFVTALVHRGHIARARS
jgi:hypothetical protein